jgi:hypothetical protein
VVGMCVDQSGRFEGFYLLETLHNETSKRVSWCSFSFLFFCSACSLLKIRRVQKQDSALHPQPLYQALTPALTVQTAIPTCILQQRTLQACGEEQRRCLCCR